MLRPPPRRIGIAVAIWLALIAGCGGPRDERTGVWIADEMVHLTDRTGRVENSPVFDARRRSVKLFAAANETVSFQLVVDADQDGEAGIRIKCSDLYSPGKDKIAASQVQPFRMLPVQVVEYPPWYLRLVQAAPQPAAFYDALVPIDAPTHGQPFSLKPDERLAVWVDLRVPRDAVSGDYTGTLTVSVLGRPDWQAGVELHVYDYVLPDARPLASVGGFSHQTLFGAFFQRQGEPFAPAHLDRTAPLVRQALTLMRQLMRLAHDHRLDLFDGSIHPLLKRDASGQVRLDWEDYDAIVTPYIDGTAFDDRIGCPAWPVPFSDSWPDAQHYGGIDAGTYAATAADVVAKCREHFSQNAEAGDRTFLWPYRGPVNADAYEHHVRLARLCRAADPVTPILSQLPAAPPEMTGWQTPEDFARLTDILAPPAQWLDPATAERLTRPTHPLVGVWFSPGTPPYVPSLGIVATPADVRALPWFAMKYRCTGLFLPEVLNWSGDLFATPAGAETRLFYPGSPFGIEAVLPSVRLKRLRRGLQDTAYLWLLRLRQREAIAESLMDALTRYAGLAAAGDNYLDPRLDGWAGDGEVWLAARKILAEELQAAVHPTEITNSQLLAQRVAWKAFHEQTRCLRVEQARAHITTEKNDRFRATVRVDLYNEYGRDTSVRLGLDKLPDGWTALDDEVQILAMPAGGRQVVALTAEGNFVPVRPNGKMYLPVTVTTDFRKQSQIAVVVPFLAPGWVRHPPAIDGMLADWPTRPGNTAADFRLLGRRGRSGAGLAARQTTVFINRDDENLYVAFRCDEPNIAGVLAKANTMIHYEQLLACGEDMVEILLDPGAAAQGPEELYHIVLKANGVLVTERGVSSRPPLGVSLPWGAKVAAAVSQHKEFWLAELAIPLSAFGPGAKADLWGVNFTRFATQGAEASSWSEAPRYFYGPENLGRMWFRPPGPGSDRTASR